MGKRFPFLPSVWKFSDIEIYRSHHAMISYLYRQQRMAVTLATLSHCRCCYIVTLRYIVTLLLHVTLSLLNTRHHFGIYRIMNAQLLSTVSQNWFILLHPVSQANQTFMLGGRLDMLGRYCKIVMYWYSDMSEIASNITCINRNQNDFESKWKNCMLWSSAVIRDLGSRSRRTRTWVFSD